MDQAETLGQLLLHGLQAAGVREIFGIPGDFALPLFKLIEESGTLPLYTLSHEPSVGFAADAAARWHCRPSAAMVTYGAGALNMVNPIAAAYAEKSPVIVVSGGPGISEDHTELLLHHQAKRLDSQFQIYREVTCAQARLSDLATAGEELSEVLAECRRQSRPVYIEVPRDLVFERAVIPRRSAAGVRSSAGDAESAAVAACVDEIVELLRAARSPVLMVGIEIRRFALEPLVAQLTRRLGIPVVTSFMGRGLLVHSGAPLIGTYLGVAGDPAITELVEHSDALIMLGVILSDTNLGISRKKIDLRRCVQVLDGQVSLGFHTYPNLPIAVVIEELLTRQLEPRVSPRLPAQDEHPLPPFSADDQEITPDDLAAGINSLWPASDPLLITADMGDCLFTAMNIENAHLLAPGYYATMGFAVPGGLGLLVASGGRPLILVGDGAFQMTGWELGHCTRYGWDPIVVVMNNSSWEMLRAFQPESQFNLLGQWDFAALARALGGEGMRVDTRRAFARAFQQAIARRGRFQLIEVMLARGCTSQTMQRFTEGLKQFRHAMTAAP